MLKCLICGRNLYKTTSFCETCYKPQNSFLNKNKIKIKSLVKNSFLNKIRRFWRWFTQGSENGE